MPLKILTLLCRKIGDNNLVFPKERNVSFEDCGKTPTLLNSIAALISKSKNFYNCLQSIES